MHLLFIPPHPQYLFCSNSCRHALIGKRRWAFKCDSVPMREALNRSTHPTAHVHDRTNLDPHLVLIRLSTSVFFWLASHPKHPSVAVSLCLAPIFKILFRQSETKQPQKPLHWRVGHSLAINQGTKGGGGGGVARLGYHRMRRAHGLFVNLAFGPR